VKKLKQLDKKRKSLKDSAEEAAKEFTKQKELQTT